MTSPRAWIPPLVVCLALAGACCSQARPDVRKKSPATCVVDAGLVPRDAPSAAPLADPPDAGPIPPAIDITVAQGRSCATLVDGTVRCWGTNLWSELGAGGEGNPRVAPTPLPDLNDVRSVTLGREVGCAVLGIGTVRCWGSLESSYFPMNETCTNGGPDRVPCAKNPIDVPKLNNVARVGINGRICALSKQGELRCWGSREAETRFASVTDVAVGLGHTCALLRDATVRCWGQNYGGQLGRGTIDFAQHPTPERVAGLRGVTQIAAGDTHVCAIAGEDASVFCWGDGEAGQLGSSGTGGCGKLERCARTPTRVAGLVGVRQVAASDNVTCALLGDGSVRCWGDDTAGQLGAASNDRCTAPTVDARRRPLACALTPLAIEGLPPFVKIATGAYSDSYGTHTCGLTADGEVWCWGDNSQGQLGGPQRPCWNPPDERSRCAEKPVRVVWR